MEVDYDFTTPEEREKASKRLARFGGGDAVVAAAESKPDLAKRAAKFGHIDER